jgi:hypothetical protein
MLIIITVNFSVSMSLQSQPIHESINRCAFACLQELDKFVSSHLGPSTSPASWNAHELLATVLSLIIRRNDESYETKVFDHCYFC